MAKNIWKVLCAGVTSVTLVACGGQSQSAPQSPTLMAGMSTTTPASLSVEQLFLDRVAQNTTLRTQVTDAELLQLAWAICNFYSQGGTTDEVVSIIIESSINNGLTESQIMEISTMAGIAVATLCPENSWRV